MTPYGKKLLLAKDSNEFKRLLEISSEGIWDECQNRWEGGAYLSADEAKFGTRSLCTTGQTLQTAAPITFGGDPFTISLWAKKYNLAGSQTYNILRVLGQTRSFGFQLKTSGQPNLDVVYGTNSVSSSYMRLTVNYTATGWVNFEFCYDGAGKLYCFWNGSKATLNGGGDNPLSMTIAREPRRIILGGFAGYVDELRIIDGVCEHTAAFTPPSTGYSLSDYPNNTAALLHFEQVSL